MSRELHVITGGGGYVGFHLGKHLSHLGHDVLLLDLRPRPYGHLDDNMTYVRCDILNFAELKKNLTGASCVYHLASYGMSGHEQLNKARIEAINVGGTENVIRACQSVGVQRLVYTSTYNVVFGGQEIRNGTEALPYFPPERHVENYSRTKTFAEQAVLFANDPQGERPLRTCALRLAGVYGPGEERHLPRIVGYIRRGLFSVVYGKRSSRVDFLHVDNLVAAHVAAGEQLKPDGRAVGQAYFISDGAPINNFEFFRPLVVGLGYSFPQIRLPLSVVYLLAFLIEIVHRCVGEFYPFQPLLTRAEVLKTGVTHYFSIDKARRDLNYEPTVQNDLSGVVKWYRDRELASEVGDTAHHPSSSLLASLVSKMLMVAVGLCFAAFVLSFLPGAN